MRTLLLGICALALAFSPGARGQTATTRSVMHEKLMHAQLILESIMVSNFDQLDRSTAALLRDIEAPGWAVLNTPDADLDKPVKFFGQPSTVRNVLYIVGTHQHEHFGLTIAYARINSVVPPWTAARQAPQQEKEKPKQ